MTKQRIIPQGALKVAAKDSSAVAYVYAVGPKVAVKAYHGKKSSPDFHFSYASKNEAAAKVAAHFKNIAAWESNRAARRAEMNAAPLGLNVGDILNTCWGYEQTNREFYEVVAISGKTATLRQVAVTSNNVGWCRDKVTPIPGDFVGDAFKVRPRNGAAKIPQGPVATKTDFKVENGRRVYGEFSVTSYA